MTVVAVEGAQQVLTADAVAFVEGLARTFRGRIEELLARRRSRQTQFDSGARPDFLPETAAIRAADWRVAPTPPDLQDRRVEITGPVDRKMVINALNSGAQVFMADFEDATSPTWPNIISGQANLIDAVRSTITYARPKPESGTRSTRRPRRSGSAAWMASARTPFASSTISRIPGIALRLRPFLFHNAADQLNPVPGPYFYLPKMESHLEARLWNESFCTRRRRSASRAARFSATVLIETLPASFEMDEILHELQRSLAGLNCGRWDYIFSSIKTLKTIRSSCCPIAAK